MDLRVCWWFVLFGHCVQCITDNVRDNFDNAVAFLSGSKFPMHVVFSNNSRCNFDMTTYNGYIYSHVGLYAKHRYHKSLSEEEKVYEPAVNCTVTLQTPFPGSNFLIQMKSGVSLADTAYTNEQLETTAPPEPSASENTTDPENSWQTCTDFLYIGYKDFDGSERGTHFCNRVYHEDELQFMSPFEFPTDSLRIQFVTARYSPGAAGFRLQYSVYRPLAENEECSEEKGYEWQCDNNETQYGRCIPMPFLCDGDTHCLDGTDEIAKFAGCSAAERLYRKLNEMSPDSLLLAIAGTTVAVVFLIAMGATFCAVANRRKRLRQQLAAAQLKKEEKERRKLEESRIAELEKRLREMDQQKAEARSVKSSQESNKHWPYTYDDEEEEEEEEG